MSWGSKPAAASRPWYADGLRFGCTTCGKCCGGGPGYVWLDEVELAEIAGRIGLPAEEFRRVYVRSLWRGLSLKEKSNYDCVLLDNAGHCIAYENRPLQCRTWPFWPSNLKTPKDWQEAAGRCPGIGRGPLIAFEQIEAQRMEMTT
jgi:uncharacterized protein